MLTLTLKINRVRPSMVDQKVMILPIFHLSSRATAKSLIH